jgi:hypothetical protein
MNPTIISSKLNPQRTLQVAVAATIAALCGTLQAQTTSSPPPLLMKPLPGATQKKDEAKDLKRMPAPANSATGTSQQRATGVGPTGGAAPQQASQMLQIRQYLDSLRQLAFVEPRQGQPQALQLPTSLAEAGYRGTFRQNTEAVTHDSLYLFQPVNSAIWPGALIQGRTVGGGTYSAIPLPRGPGRIRLSGGFVSGNLTRDIPAAVDVDRVRIDLVRSTGATDIASPSQFELISARDFSEAAAKLGISYDGPSLTASGNVSVRMQSDEVMIVGRYTQAFYTASFEPLALPGAADTRPHMFAPSVTLSDVQAYANNENPPLYVSDVTYGIMALVFFTAKGSVAEVEAAAKAAYGGVQADANFKYKATSDSMSIRVIQLGIPGARQINPASIQQGTVRAELEQLINQNRRFNVATNPGLPIQMALKYVGSGRPDAIASIQLVTNTVDVVNINPPPKQCTTHQVWDGPGGGWRRVQIGGKNLNVNPGDKLDINYRSGTNTSGVFGDWAGYGANGWHTWDRPKDGELGFPITNKSPFGLIGRLGSGARSGPDPAYQDKDNCRNNCSAAFWIGESRQVTAGELVNVQYGELWLGTNDNDPTNGDANKKWNIDVCIQRKDFGNTSTGGARKFSL